MIRIACTNCRQVLTIDDAFAGGVCRCQHCGTIQTVPAAAAGGAEVAVGGPDLGGGRVSPGGSTSGGAGYALGTGLDDLAGAVASSGLSSRRLLRPDGTAAGGKPAAVHYRPATAGRRNLVPLFAAAGVVIVGLLGVIAYLATRPTGTAINDPGPSVILPAHGPVAPPPTAAPAGPNFCGTPLAGDTVVYVLDRGTATQEVFSALKDAALKSALSLGSGRHFQVVFWANPGEDVTAFPASSPAYASAENVEAARRALADVIANGRTDVQTALTLALSQRPDTVVLATAKGGDLDDAWVKAALDARGSSPARLDTFNLGTPADPATTPALKTLAQRAGGVYVELSNADLTAAAGE